MLEQILAKVLYVRVIKNRAKIIRMKNILIITICVRVYTYSINFTEKI
jgi:hypothetical protein